ncbi:MAG: hypothetical protein CSB21_03175 [Deltaproteobacteria bacterium]|nr:MAG: hypothetical protein CSB21_03175 [Deltaproteobacteria bacterium]
MQKETIKHISTKIPEPLAALIDPKPHQINPMRPGVFTYLGIDIGSSSTKLVLVKRKVKEKGKLRAWQ